MRRSLTRIEANVWLQKNLLRRFWPYPTQQILLRRFFCNRRKYIVDQIYYLFLVYSGASLKFLALHWNFWRYTENFGAALKFLALPRNFWRCTCKIYMPKNRFTVHNSNSSPFSNHYQHLRLMHLKPNFFT